MLNLALRPRRRNFLVSSRTRYVRVIGIRRRGLRGRPFSVSVHRIERRGGA